MKNTLKALAIFTVLGMFTAPTAHAVDVTDKEGLSHTTAYWGGASWMEDSWYTYAGGMRALQGTLDDDGLVARIGVGYGEYDYDTVTVPGGNVDGETIRIDALLGYQTFFPTGRFVALIGPDYINHDLSPTDPDNSVEGAEFGVKGQLELTKQWDEKHVVNFAVNASSAFRTYWTNARVTRDMGDYSIGPEVSFLGSESFNQTRVGAYLGDVEFMDTDLNFQAGYTFAGRRGDDSVHLGLGFSGSF